MEEAEKTKNVGLYGILGNLFLLIIKSLIAFASRSQAMLADTVNSATDIFASLMTFVGNKISSEPSDANHDLGHGKAEYIFSMIISISMIVLSFKILFDAIFSIIAGNELIFSWPLIIICLVTILVKIGLYFYARSVYKTSKNLLVKANMEDHRNDVAVTSLTVVSIVLSLYGIYWVDGVVGILISFWIMFTGFRIFIESYNVLMDMSLATDVKEKMIDIIKDFKEIQDVNEIYSTPIGRKYIVVFTIYVDGNMTTRDSNNIADELQNRIKSEIDVIEKLVIHVHPI